MVSSSDTTTTANVDEDNENAADGFLASVEADEASFEEKEAKKAKVEETMGVSQESDIELAKYVEAETTGATLDAEVLVDGLKLEEAKDKIVMLQNELLSSASIHGEDVTALSKQIEDLYFQLSKERELVAALKKEADGDVSFDISDVKLNALNRTFIKRENEYKEKLTSMTKELKEKDLNHEKALEELRLKIDEEVSNNCKNNKNGKDEGMKKDLDDAIQRIVNLQKNLLDAKDKGKDETSANQDIETMKSEFSTKASEYEEKIKTLTQELKDNSKAHAEALTIAGEVATASLKKEHEEELRKRDLALEGTIQKFQKKMEKELSHDRTYTDLVQAKEKIRGLETELQQAQKKLEEETGALTQSLQEVQSAFFERENAYNYELNKMAEEAKKQPVNLKQ